MEPAADAGRRIPILTTKRLVLRGPRRDDFPAFAAMWGDEDNVRRISAPDDEEAAWSKFLRLYGHWAALGFGYWIVERGEDGAFLGQVGFYDLKRKIEPSIVGEPEIGWVLAPAAHGEGFATEAAMAAIEWIDAEMDRPTLSCLIEPGHRPSFRVAEKCGFAEVATAPYHGQPVTILRRPGGQPTESKP